MEYYAGVLFLTTNRVGDFDEAFTSRIHVSLYYPELSKNKTIEVFKINMNMINERFEAKERTIVVDGIIPFASDHYKNHPLARWNGRQIRNACQTALALAEFEAQGNSMETILKPNALVHLKVSHFQTVQKAYLEFAQYMNSLYGTTSSTRAKENRIRAIWIDENDNVVGTQSMGGAFKLRQEAFLLASQGQQQSRSAQPQPQAQQVFQQEVPLQAQQGFQQQAIPMVNQGIPNPGVQQYYQYPNVVAPQPMYTQAPGLDADAAAATVFFEPALERHRSECHHRLRHCTRRRTEPSSTTATTDNAAPATTAATGQSSLVRAGYSSHLCSGQPTRLRTKVTEQLAFNNRRQIPTRVICSRPAMAGTSRASRKLLNKLTNSHSLILSRYFYRLIFVYMTKA
jgi:hypothetical protein